MCIPGGSTNRPGRTSFTIPSFSNAVQDYPELVPRYLGSVVPHIDSSFAALNSAVFTDGSSCFIPRGVRCPMEHSMYYRVNAADHTVVRGYHPRDPENQRHLGRDRPGALAGANKCAGSVRTNRGDRMLRRSAGAPHGGPEQRPGDGSDPRLLCRDGV